MDIIDEIDGLAIKGQDEDEVMKDLAMYIRRAIIPLSLMDLQNFDFLPRDWDVLEHVLPKVDEAKEVFGKEMVDSPDLIKLGNLSYVKHEFSKACDFYERALALDEMLQARKNLGIALIASGKIDRAMEVLDESVKKFEEDHELWFYLGLAWEQKAHEQEHISKELRDEHLNKTLEFYSKALEISPEFSVARYNKGMVLVLLGRKEEAKELVLEVLKEDPASEGGWIARGLLLRSTGDHEGALKCYSNAITINPDSHLGWLNKSVALFGLGKYEESLEAADKALELNKTSEIAWSNKGAVLSEVDRFEEAVECFDKAIELNPDFEGAKRNRDRARKAIEEDKGG